MEISLHSLEWQKPKILTTPNAGKAVKQQELSFIAGRDAEWHSHFGTVWQFLTKHILTI